MELAQKYPIKKIKVFTQSLLNLVKMSISKPVPFFIIQALFQKLRNVENKNGMSRVVTLYLCKTDCTNFKKSSQLMCFCSQKS